jgi:diacylglycerol kinase family enzyme
MIDGEHMPYGPVAVECVPHMLRVFCGAPLETPGDDNA